jgi:hypothetical protein
MRLMREAAAAEWAADLVAHRGGGGGAYGGGVGAGVGLGGGGGGFGEPAPSTAPSTAPSDWVRERATALLGTVRLGGSLVVSEAVLRSEAGQTVIKQLRSLKSHWCRFSSPRPPKPNFD